MFRCIVRLEIKAHECYCEGTGYGGDRITLNQGEYCNMYGEDDNDGSTGHKLDEKLSMKRSCCNLSIPCPSLKSHISYMFFL